jgi:hypothetical protein
VPIASAIGIFHFDGSAHPMDVTADGDTVAFAAFAGAGDYIMTVPGEGGTPQIVAGPYDILTHVAISDDAATVAWGMVQAGSYDVGIVRGSAPKVLLDIGNEVNQPLQLSEDGKWLLIGTDGRLFDTESLLARPLATQDPNSSQPSPLLSVGVDRVTMSRDATKFLYVLGVAGATPYEQLAMIALGADTGDAAPFVRDVRVDRREIPIDGSVKTVGTISLSWNGQLTSVGMMAIYLGERDPNIYGGGRIFDANGELVQLSQVRQGSEGIFTTDEMYYVVTVAREDDTGPRTLRVYAEAKDVGGLSHATAIDFGTLTVVGGN